MEKMGTKDNLNIKTEITKIHYNKDAKGALVKFLEFASIFYGIGSRFKNLLYDKNILRPKKVDAFVISVGNITTGGVGKTPVVSEIAKYFISKGEKTAIISRGYGGKFSNKNINVISDGERIYYNARLAGDEPFWLAQNTKCAIVITSKNRYKASKYAIEKFGATKIILDDGFQHRKLHRDLDIVLMDSEKGFGNEKLLPAGPLREGTESFTRIDRLVIVSKNTDHHTKAEKLARIMSKKMHLQTQVCYTEPDCIYNIKTGQHQSIVLPDLSCLESPVVGILYDNVPIIGICQGTVLGSFQNLLQLFSGFTRITVVENPFCSFMGQAFNGRNTGGCSRDKTLCGR